MGKGLKPRRQTCFLFSQKKTSSSMAFDDCARAGSCAVAPKWERGNNKEICARSGEKPISNEATCGPPGSNVAQETRHS